MAVVQAPVEQPLQPSTGERRSLRILLAEDNADNQYLAVALLAKQGHVVIAATNGKEAVAAFDRESFDLILMDVQMPEMGGFEATDLIRSREAKTGGHIPIIALTARAMNGDRERCLAAGMDGYASKPIQGGTLAALIDGFFPAQVAAPDPRPSAPDDAGLETDALLAHFEGDRELLRDVAETFLDTAPALMHDTAAAVARRDLVAIKHTAHSWKGSLGNFGAAAAVGAAVSLEQLAIAGDIGRVDAVFAGFQEEVSIVGDQLRAMLPALR